MRIVQVEPAQIELSSRQTARVRVRGRGAGLLSCQGQRRWVFGDFDESFVVRPRGQNVLVRGWGVSGISSVRVPSTIWIDVDPPHVPRAYPGVPRARISAIVPPRVPRLLSLDAMEIVRLAGRSCSEGSEA